jgi:hypothetical protein
MFIATKCTSSFMTFLAPCCDVRYDLHIITMFGSSLSPVVCVLLCVLTFLAPCWVKTNQTSLLCVNHNEHHNTELRKSRHIIEHKQLEVKNIIRMFGSSLPPVVCVLLCVLTFLAPCCDVRYDLHIMRMFGSSLPPVVCVLAKKVKTHNRTQTTGGKDEPNILIMCKS